MVRICLIALLTSFSCPLHAQWRDTAWLVDPGIERISHQRTKQFEIPAPASRLYLWGEVKLKRLGNTVNKFTIDMPGDTVNVLVTNKDGFPFKKISWTFGDSKAVPAKNTASYHWKGSDTLTRQASLRINAPFSLKRQYARIQISSTKAAKKATVTNSIDTFLLREKKIIVAIKEETTASLEGKGSLHTDWKYQRFPGPGNNLTQIQTGSLQIARSPAQVKKLMPSGPPLLPRLFKTRVVTYQDFKTGDTLIIAVQAKGAIKCITLKNAAGDVLNRAYNTVQFNDTIVASDKETAISLYIRDNLSLKNNFADVLVTRLRPVKADSVYFVNDTTLKSSRPILYDTLLLTICDDSLHLSPTWNIESNAFDQIAVQIPKEAGEGYKLLFVAYWIGIGRSSINEYQNLEATVPPEWGKPGASLLLTAFGFRHPLIMPVSATDEVLFAFSAKKRAELVKTGQKKLPTTLSYWPGKKYSGRINLDELSKKAQSGKSLATGTPSYNFFACFQNTGTVNTWPISVKMVGFYQSSTPAPEATIEMKVSSNKIPLSK